MVDVKIFSQIIISTNFNINSPTKVASTTKHLALAISNRRIQIIDVRQAFLYALAVKIFKEVRECQLI